MESYLAHYHYDLVSPDGIIEKISFKDSKSCDAIVSISDISPRFKGFEIETSLVHFNLKSTYAQLGINSADEKIKLNSKKRSASINLKIYAIDTLGIELLKFFDIGISIGKLFTQDLRRRVRDPEYLLRMFRRSDRSNRPLLSFGSSYNNEEFIIEKIKDRTIAFIALKPGIVKYDKAIYGFLPTLIKALKHGNFSTRNLVQLHQVFEKSLPRITEKNQMLLVKTAPLHIRTVYAKVVDELLPKGFTHTKANVLQPDTFASGDIYELYGSSEQELDSIPLEFYTLEPHREHVFFEDRDQLQASLEDKDALFKVFETIPDPKLVPAAVFVVKGEQLKNLKPKDWIQRDPYKHEFPGITHPSRQALIVEKYIEKQPSYPFLKAIEDGLITSQGVLFTNYFPTPLMKRLLLENYIQKALKAIYFKLPSYSYGNYFSYEDRAFLVDLAKFGIPVFWVDSISNKILQFVLKPEKDTGMFVPINLIDDFRKATVFGVYGSNLEEGPHEFELRNLFEGILKLKNNIEHPLIHYNAPIAIVTGGGPGVMELGNRVAKNLNILSCANIVDFRTNKKSLINEQKINRYIDVKMTYRLDHLVERQAEFHLDFPIILPGGIGTDFEYSLEEVRRKTGSCSITPVILFGSKDYWVKKITSRFQCNLKTQTIKGSEWVSNCFYCVQTSSQALLVYKKFFSGTLKIGKNERFYEAGFCNVSNEI
jgi:predicted Rossmann-fold nucleotide-binding protein